MARTTKPLTNTEVEKAKPKEKDYSLMDGQGLFLRVKVNGTKTWLYNYQRPVSNKRTNIGIGRYPDVSLAQARIKHREYVALLAQNIDPQIYKQEQTSKQLAQVNNTFLMVASRWREKRSREIEPLTMKKNWERLENHLFPTIGNYQIDKITSPILIEAVKPLDVAGKNDTLHRIINLANQIMNYAVTLGIIPYNICSKAADAYPKKAQEHHPAIHYENLPKLLADFEESNRDKRTKMLFKWQLLSMVRPAEAVSVEWEEIDFKNKIWNIPKEKMKKVRTGQFAHSVPLSTQLLAILKELKPITGEGKFVFPHYSHPNEPMSSETITNALRKIGYQGIQDSHGLRTVARTYLEDKGVDFRHAESCLAHKVGDSTSRAYNRTEYIEQRRPLMQLWGDYCEKCGMQFTF